MYVNMNRHCNERDRINYVLICYGYFYTTLFTLIQRIYFGIRVMAYNPEFVYNAKRKNKLARYTRSQCIFRFKT